jgi:hypothetical protein
MKRRLYLTPELRSVKEGRVQLTVLLECLIGRLLLYSTVLVHDRTMHCMSLLIRPRTSRPLHIFVTPCDFRI